MPIQEVFRRQRETIQGSFGFRNSQVTFRDDDDDECETKATIQHNMAAIGVVCVGCVQHLGCVQMCLFWFSSAVWVFSVGLCLDVFRCLGKFRINSAWF